jgi:hypothetical protein
MKHTRDTAAMSPPTTRSAISNGTRLLANVDGRSSSSRRFRDLVAAFDKEIGGAKSEIERALIRDAAALTFKAETLQADLVNGVAVDGDQLIRLTGTSKRILSDLRVRAAEHKAKPKPSLTDHIAKHHSAKRQEQEIAPAE